MRPVKIPPRDFITFLSLLITFVALSACTQVVAQTGQLPEISPSPVNQNTDIPQIPTITSTTADSPRVTEPPTTDDFSPTYIPNQTKVPAISIEVPSYTATAVPPDYWMSLPIIPTVSQTAREIYQRGMEIGRDSRAFSKIGDCQSISTYFLSYFDKPDLYKLGEYASLQDTIDWYTGSFSRDSLAVKGGFNAAAVLSPLRADPKQCHTDENPIACEFRLHNPSVAIISLEEWWAGHPENYEKYMRQIIVFSIQQGVVPIIATKADNLEGNHLINQTIGRLALEYDIPLWNFWLAVQPLPNHGLTAFDVYGQVDMFHLTHGEGYFSYDNPDGIQSGWSMRNFTALQALDSVRRGLTSQP